MDSELEKIRQKYYEMAGEVMPLVLAKIKGLEGNVTFLSSELGRMTALYEAGLRAKINGD